MTTKKTPRKGATTKKAAAKKKTSSKTKSAASHKGTAKGTSSAKTPKTKKSSPAKAPKTKKTASVKKPTSSNSAANKKKTGAKKKSASTGKKAAVSKKTVSAATKKKVASEEKGEPATKASPPKKSSREKGSTQRVPATKPRPIAFSLEEARKIAQNRSKTASEAPPKRAADEPASKRAAAESQPGSKKTADSHEPKPAARVLGAASLADILGRNPNASSNPLEEQKKEVPKKHQRYFSMLQELREHVLSELDLHTKDTLKRSAKEDSGNLSGYGQHMADDGTDSFDRDFALSLVSTEQEALSEIEAAIERIHKGTYGVCEITGKPIAKERLMAVPFARYSIEGQVEFEKTQRRPSQRGGAYLDSGSDGGEFLTEDPDE